MNKLLNYILLPFKSVDWYVNKLPTNIILLFRPTYWIMNWSMSDEWDVELNELLDNHSFSFHEYTAYTELRHRVDTYYVKLGSKCIWIRNHPYASFVSDDPAHSRCRARRSTILKAEAKIQKELGLNLYRSNDNSNYVLRQYIKLHNDTNEYTN